jgi:hypothetical protein
VEGTIQEWEIRDFFNFNTGETKQRIMVGIDSMKCDYLLKSGLGFDSDEEAEAYGYKVMPTLPIKISEVHKNMERVALEAAAPDLLDALQDVVDLLEMLGIADNTAINKAYAALAKAKGGQNG